MRVIAGKFRSRLLASLRGLDLRPTSDRLRETLFNVLTAGNPEALAGSIWLDLFAGTGAVGIEALSRGVDHVYFVESSKPAAELISRNLQALGIKTGFQVLQLSVSRSLAVLEAQSVQPGFIFLDPPYRLTEAYAATLSSLSRSPIARSALIIAEHENRFDPGEEFGALQRARLLRQGDAALSFYRSNNR